MSSSPIQFTVGRGESGRLDKVLTARFPGVGRRRFAEWIEGGAVTVNGRRATKGDHVDAGAEIALHKPPPTGEALSPVPQPDLVVEVLLEAPHLLAIAKPAGVPSHPLRAGETGTAANAIVARYPECAGASTDPREGGLIHRLDRGTSGVLVAARDRPTWHAMREAFAHREIDKHYLALVSGRAGVGESDAALLQRGRRSVATRDDHPGAQPSHSSWEPVASTALDPSPQRSDHDALTSPRAVTLLRVSARTGRMHQVRAHLADAGHPLIGDSLYGGPTELSLGDLRLSVESPFLHAERIELPSPTDPGRRLSITAPMPRDRAALLERLGLHIGAA